MKQVLQIFYRVCKNNQGGLKTNPQWLATVTLLHKAMLESTKNNFATSEVKQLRRFSQ